MALEVIGSGFGRTGTGSLKLALEQLGFGPCHHMEVVLATPPQVPYWQAAVAGQAMDWDTVFDGFRSQCDWPGAHCWQALASAYPDAKVIHTVRPEENWWGSFSATIGVLMGMYPTLPLPPHVRAMMDVARTMVADQTFGAAFTDREAALAAFRRRTEQVRAAIAPGRLLVFDVAQGWEPLCDFLGVPVPDAPFPHANSTEEWWAKVRGGPR